MSFFAKLGSGSDTDTDSGSESEESILSGDEGLEQDQKLKAATKTPKNRASMFLRSDDEGESEEDDEEIDDDDDEEDEDSDASGAGRQVSDSSGRYAICSDA